MTNLISGHVYTRSPRHRVYAYTSIPELCFELHLAANDHPPRIGGCQNKTVDASRPDPSAVRLVWLRETDYIVRMQSCENAAGELLRGATKYIQQNFIPKEDYSSACLEFLP